MSFLGKTYLLLFHFLLFLKKKVVTCYFIILLLFFWKNLLLVTYSIIVLLVFWEALIIYNLLFGLLFCYLSLNVLIFKGKRRMEFEKFPSKSCQQKGERKNLRGRPGTKSKFQNTFPVLFRKVWNFLKEIYINFFSKKNFFFNFLNFLRLNSTVQGGP